MLATLLYLLLYLLIAVIVLEVIFWILSMIFPGGLITMRIRGLLYALVLLILLIWALNHLGIMHI